MADAAPSTDVARFARLADEGLFDRLAPGLYAWGVTVAWPASQRLAPLTSRVLAGVALVSLLGGATLSRFWPRAARIAGLWGFVAASLGTWVLLTRTLGPTRLDPIQGILGWLGWAVFAISWGGTQFTGASGAVPRSRHASSVSTAARSAPSQAAVATRRRATGIMGAIAIAAAIPVVLAWWVETTERALLAHAVSLAAALAMVTLAVEPALASRAQDPVSVRGGRSSSRLLEASTSLLLLAGLLLLGAVYGLLR